MNYVYVLKSLKNGKQYTGVTSKDPQLRLKEHNGGTNSFTRQNRPFQLVYTENFEDEQKARSREKFLKTGQGRRFIKRVIPP
ncbi:MAG: GIY-YIG nuclease family protein [Candidatus Omnitrophota bacterium]